MSSRRKRTVRGEGPRQPSFAVPFSPRDIPNLVAWWDGEGPFSQINDPAWTDPLDMSTANWTRTGVTVTPGGAGPAGVLDANLILNDATNVRHGVTQTVGISDGYTAITVSAKAGTGRYLVIANTTTIYRVFDLQTGAIGAQQNAGTSTITALGGGWYECYMELQSTTSSFTLAISEANSFTSYVGTGVTISVANPRIVRRNIQQWDPTYAVTANYVGLQNVAASRPSMFASPNHGRVKYDGTQQYMQISTVPGDFKFLNANDAAGCTTVTVLGIGVLAALTTAGVVWDNHDDDHVSPPVSPGAALAVLASGKLLYQLSDGAANIVNQSSTTTFVSGNKVCVVTRAGEAQSPQYSMRCNAVENTGSFSAPSSPAASLYNMFTGIRAGLTGLRNNGFILGMGFWDRYMTDAEVLQIEQYSRNRWGIPV